MKAGYLLDERDYIDDLAKSSYAYFCKHREVRRLFQTWDVILVINSEAKTKELSDVLVAGGARVKVLSPEQLNQLNPSVSQPTTA